MEKEYDVVGIGNALLDITYNVREDIIKELQLKKGEAKSIDEDESKLIIQKLDKEKSLITLGGSCSNTISGVTCLGGKTAFFGKIGNDNNGKLYESKTMELGIHSKLSRHENKIT